MAVIVQIIVVVVIVIAVMGLFLQIFNFSYMLKSEALKITKKIIDLHDLYYRVGDYLEDS